MTGSILGFIPGSTTTTGYAYGYSGTNAPPTPAANTGTQPVANHRGIASLSYGGGTLVFRTNPNEVWWSYSLLTNVEQTYGGRVVQILGTRVDDLVIKVDCGRGGWPYAQRVIAFMRDFMIQQRQGQPGTFMYTTRNWNMKVFAVSVPFQDTVTATTREISLTFKVQQDVSGIMSALGIVAELASLTQGMGPNTTYNTAQPGQAAMQGPTWMSPLSIPSNVMNMTSSIPGLSNIISGGSGVISGGSGIGSLLGGSGASGLLGSGLSGIPVLSSFGL